MDSNAVLESVEYTRCRSPKLQNFQVAEAVSISALTPGWFQPFAIKDLYPRTIVRLADGGLYDNYGLSTLYRDGADFIIASDGSSKLQGLAHTQTHTHTCAHAHSLMHTDVRAAPGDAWNVLSRCLDLDSNRNFQRVTRELQERAERNGATQMCFVYLQQHHDLLGAKLKHRATVYHPTVSPVSIADRNATRASKPMPKITNDGLRRRTAANANAETEREGKGDRDGDRKRKTKTDAKTDGKKACTTQPAAKQAKSTSTATAKPKEEPVLAGYHLRPMTLISGPITRPELHTPAPGFAHSMTTQIPGSPQSQSQSHGHRHKHKPHAQTGQTALPAHAQTHTQTQHLHPIHDAQRPWFVPAAAKARAPLLSNFSNFHAISVPSAVPAAKTQKRTKQQQQPQQQPRTQHPQHSQHRKAQEERVLLPGSIEASDGETLAGTDRDRDTGRDRDRDTQHARSHSLDLETGLRLDTSSTAAAAAATSKPTKAKAHTTSTTAIATATRRNSDSLNENEISQSSDSISGILHKHAIEIEEALRDRPPFKATMLSPLSQFSPFSPFSAFTDTPDAQNARKQAHAHHARRRRRQAVPIPAQLQTDRILRLELAAWDDEVLALLSNVRTNVDRFTEVEMMSLMAAGYMLASGRLRACRVRVTLVGCSFVCSCSSCFACCRSRSRCCAVWCVLCRMRVVSRSGVGLTSQHRAQPSRGCSNPRKTSSKRPRKTAPLTRNCLYVTHVHICTHTQTHTHTHTDAAFSS